MSTEKKNGLAIELKWSGEVSREEPILALAITTNDDLPDAKGMADLSLTNIVTTRKAALRDFLCLRTLYDTEAGPWRLGPINSDNALDIIDDILTATLKSDFFFDSAFGDNSWGVSRTMFLRVYDGPTRRPLKTYVRKGYMDTNGSINREPLIVESH